MPFPFPLSLTPSYPPYLPSLPPSHPPTLPPTLLPSLPPFSPSLPPSYPPSHPPSHPTSLLCLPHTLPGTPLESLDPLVSFKYEDTLAVKSCLLRCVKGGTSGGVIRKIKNKELTTLGTIAPDWYYLVLFQEFSLVRLHYF